MWIGTIRKKHRKSPTCSLITMVKVRGRNNKHNETKKKTKYWVCECIDDRANKWINIVNEQARQRMTTWKCQVCVLNTDRGLRNTVSTTNTIEATEIFSSLSPTGIAVCLCRVRQSIHVPNAYCLASSPPMMIIMVCSMVHFFSFSLSCALSSAAQHTQSQNWLSTCCPFGHVLCVLYDV